MVGIECARLLEIGAPSGRLQRGVSEVIAHALWDLRIGRDYNNAFRYTAPLITVPCSVPVPVPPPVPESLKAGERARERAWARVKRGHPMQIIATPDAPK